MKVKELYEKETGDIEPYLGDYTIEAMYEVATKQWKERYIKWLEKQVEKALNQQ